MLIELKFVEEKINDHNRHLKKHMEKHGDDEDNIFSSMLIDINNNPFFINMKDFDKKQKKCPIGFYCDGVNAEYDVPKLTNLKVEKTYNSFMADNIKEWHKYKNPRENFGVCDNYKQIIKEYPELKKDKLRKFIVVMSPITKKDSGGWRWHKWGRYLGKYKPKHEYLCNEDIDMVWVFHILEVEYDNTGEPNELCKINKDSDVYVFGSNKLEVHYASKLNLETVYFEYHEKPALLKHLMSIQKFGIKVPKRCISRLKREIKKEVKEKSPLHDILEEVRNMTVEDYEKLYDEVNDRRRPMEINDEKIKVILPAKDLIGKTVSKITGEKLYIVTDKVKMYNSSGDDVVAEEGVLFLLEGYCINCIPADKELKWETTYEELYNFLHREINYMD